MTGRAKSTRISFDDLPSKIQHKKQMSSKFSNTYEQNKNASLRAIPQVEFGNSIINLQTQRQSEVANSQQNRRSKAQVLSSFLQESDKMGLFTSSTFQNSPLRRRQIKCEDEYRQEGDQISNGYSLLRKQTIFNQIRLPRTEKGVEKNCKKFIQIF